MVEQNTFMNACAIAIVYALTKFIEKRFILKEDLVVKDMVRDTVIVYVSSVIGLFIVEQVSDGITTFTPTTAFTGKPDF